jgi:ABC-type phosphate transport system substrate-binding protein
MGTVSLNGIAPTRENIADNRYPLRLTLYIAGRAEPVDHMRAFIGWVQSPAGQAIIARCCVPLQP